MNTNEKEFKPVSAYGMVVITLVLIIAGFSFLSASGNPIGGLFILAAFACLKGFFFINPNGSRVLTLFGKYIGTVKSNGFFWANPFYMRKPISLRARNFDSERVKVNDKIGNPILISVILVWKVKDTYNAAFDVDNYESFVGSRPMLR